MIKEFETVSSTPPVTHKEPEVMGEVSIQQFPEEISAQIKILTELEKKVNEAKELGDKAKQDSETLQGYVESRFLFIKHKGGDTKKIVEETQDVVKRIGLATESNSQALDLVYQYQDATQKAIEYLFSLGCVNFAATEAMINDINSIRDGKTKLKGIVLSDEVKARLQTVAERLRQQQEIRKRQDRLEQKFLEETRTVSKRVDDAETMLKQQIYQGCREVYESMENEISSVTKTLGEQIAQARQDAKESSDKALHEAEHSLGREINEAKEIAEKELRGAIDNLENNVAKTRLFMKEDLDNSNKGLRRRILWSYVIGCLGLLSSIITLTLSVLGIL